MTETPRARFLRQEQVVIAGIIVLMTLYAALRADWLFDTYRATDKVCPEIDRTVDGDPVCSLDPLLRELEKLQDYTFIYVWRLSRVHWCRSDDPRAQMCQPVPDALKGKMIDPMLTTGYATVFIGLWISIWLEPLFRRMSGQLRRDAVIEWRDTDEADVDLWRIRLSYGVTLIVGISVFMGFTIFHFGGLPAERLAREFLISAVILACLCGHRLGTAAALGRVGRIAVRRGASVRLILGHADGMGGAKRLGEFLAFQGVLISIPIAWLTTWLLLVWTAPDIYRGLEHWFWLHLVLLIISLTISIFSFIRPLMNFSGHYRQQREAAKVAWHDKTRSELLRVQNHTTHADWRDMKEAIETSKDITSVSEALAALPSVPLRRSVQGIFSLSAFFPIAAFTLELALKSSTGADGDPLTFMASMIGLLAKLVGG